MAAQIPGTSAPFQEAWPEGPEGPEGPEAQPQAWTGPHGGHTCVVIIASQPVFMQLEVFTDQEIAQLQTYQGAAMFTIYSSASIPGSPRVDGRGHVFEPHLKPQL